MKKLTLTLLLTLALLLLLFSIAGCTIINVVPPSFEAIGKKMSGITSYDSKVNLDMLFYLNEKEVKLTGDGTVYLDERNSESPRYFLDLEVSTAEDEIEVGSSQFIGYKDGRAYLYEDSAGSISAHTSQMSYEDFKELFLKSDTSDLEFNADWEAEKNEDGDGWIFTTDSCTGSAVDKLVSSYSDYITMMGCDFKGVAMTMHVRGDLYVSKMEVNFLFDGKDGERLPEMSYSVEYKSFSPGEKTSYKYDFDYTEIDLKTLKYLDDSYLELVNARAGRFAISIRGESSDTTVIPDSSQFYNIGFGYEYGEFHFDGTLNLGGNRVYTLDYKNKIFIPKYKGPQNVIHPSFPRIKSDAAARSYVQSVIRSFGYSKSIITSIEKTHDGVYTAICGNFDDAPEKELLESIGITYFGSDAKLIFTFNGDTLQNIKLAITIHGEYQGNAFTYEVTQNFNMALEE